MALLPMAPGVSIDERELELSFIRAAGPGGQNVNKVASAVQLRFDVRRSPTLPEGVRQRLLAQLASRLTGEGVLVLTARGERSQERNRHEVLARLAALIRRALVPPKPRRATRPTRGSQERRLADKQRRKRLKRQRGRGAPGDEG